MAEPPPVLTLLVEKGPRKGQSVQQRAGAVLRVGRVVKGNDLAVGDAGASQRHLDLAFLPPPAARWAATDLGSSNGTLLNGAPLVPTIPAPLSHGDRIKIGESTVLAVSIAADAGPEPAVTRRSTRQAAAAVVEEEDKAPPVRRGRRKAPVAADSTEAVKEEAVVAPRRGRPKKAPAATDPPEAEKEEPAAVRRRGGRKKAVELPEAEGEDEEEVLPGGPSIAPATAALPPQTQTTRSTRAAARRGESVGTGQGKGEGEQTGRGRGRVTRQSARKAKEVIHVDEEEEEEEAIVPEEQMRSPPRVTASKSAKGKDDKVEKGDGTSNASEVEVPVATSKPAEGTRKGRGRVRASSRKAKDPITEEEDEKEGEEGNVVNDRECRENPQRVMVAKGGEGQEDEVTTRNVKVDEALKASVADQVVEGDDDAPLAPRGQTNRASNGRADTYGGGAAAADNGGQDIEEGKESGREEESGINQELREKMVPESKPDGVEEAGEDVNREVSGGSGEERGGKNVNMCPEGCTLDNMTLREWFVQIEKYILAKNHEAAEKAIAEVEEKHRLFTEYVKTLK